MMIVKIDKKANKSFIEKYGLDIPPAAYYISEEKIELECPAKLSSSVAAMSYGLKVGAFSYICEGSMI